MLELGTTIWNLSGPISLLARKASYSQEMNTSPTPRSVEGLALWCSPSMTERGCSCGACLWAAARGRDATLPPT